MDSKLKPQVLLSQAEIQATVKRLAAEIARDYRERQPILVGILKGSFVFMADLVRQLDFPLQVEFVQVSSYGQCSQTSGNIKLLKDIDCPVKDRHVLVIEDIVDSGLTTSFLLDHIRQRQPASVKLCSLADKPSRRRVSVTINYLGVTVPDKFIVGYGIDYNERFRNLPTIGTLEVEC